MSSNNAASARVLTLPIQAANTHLRTNLHAFLVGSSKLPSHPPTYLPACLPMRQHTCLHDWLSACQRKHLPIQWMAPTHLKVEPLPHAG